MKSLILGQLVLCSAPAWAAYDLNDFGRDVLNGRSSILIIGDSTNNPRGSSGFVPYYEGFLRRLPTTVPICGFRVSESTGNTAVEHYVRFGGGSTDQFVDSRVNTRTPDDLLQGSVSLTIPGYRNEFTLLPQGTLPEFGRFASIAMTDINRICPAAATDWLGGTLGIRTVFVVDPEERYLGSFAVQPLSDHDGSAGDSIWGFEGGHIIDVELVDDRWGLQPVDTVFENVPTSRIGVRFAGDTDQDDADEGGKSVSFGPVYFYSVDLLSAGRGLFYDSVSIGGYSAGDHARTLTEGSLREYILSSPRAPNWVVVWLGQNMDPDEWNGSLQPVFRDRIEVIADTAVQAVAAAGSPPPRVLLVTPPAASGDYPSTRFSAAASELNALAQTRGWVHLDLHELIGNSLASIDDNYTMDGVHPTLAGSEYVCDAIIAQLNCWRAELTGDDQLNIFDVQAYLGLFTTMDPRADFNGDDELNVFDLMAYIDSFSAPCP
ncbi:MAG: SGNH/GDSL hydrolase family protein [Planctomycetota bacterium]|nr:MAG: SGNH/GDSL hydrolase family protein [Planctomycetota bacterium]